MEATIEPLPLRRIGMTAKDVRNAIAKYLQPDPKPARTSFSKRWNGYPQEEVEEITNGMLEILQDGEWHINFEIAEALKTTTRYIGRRVNQLNKAGTHIIIHKRSQQDSRPKLFKLIRKAS